MTQPAPSTPITPLIELRGVTKRYGAVLALDQVHFQINPGEVIGLLGDNGAGKSTLVKILSGIVQPTEGVFLAEGKPVRVRSRRDSYRLGIETIYQDIALIDQMDIMRNIFLGREETNFLGFLRMNHMKKKAMEVLEHTVGISGIRSTDQYVGGLSGGQKQAVALARAVYFKNTMLLLDEPTSALSVRETEKTLQYIRDLKKEGVSSVLVTHNMYHGYHTAERFVILSKGRVIKEVRKEDTSIEELTDIVSST
jgi:simple sugar transport system ATP-binding protein